MKMMTNCCQRKTKIWEDQKGLKTSNSKEEILVWRLGDTQDKKGKNKTRSLHLQKWIWRICNGSINRNIDRLYKATFPYSVYQSAMNKLCVLLGDTTIQAFVNIDRNLKEFIVAYILTIKILF